LDGVCSAGRVYAAAQSVTWKIALGYVKAY
jgi:hypothetical protein